MAYRKNLLIALCALSLLSAEEKAQYQVSFPHVSMVEVVKFTSKVAGVNFICDQKLLDFDISFLSGKPLTADEVLHICLNMLEEHQLEAIARNNSYYIRKKEEGSLIPSILPALTDKKLPITKIPLQFQVYKLQYHQGSEIITALKQLSPDLFDNLKETIDSIQWIASTNSLCFSGPIETLAKLSDLIASLDTALKQVFIEVLVIETTLQSSLDFGLRWAASTNIENRVGAGGSSTNPHHGEDSFTHMLQTIDGKNTPKGASQIPFGRGFDLGIIGDLIWHKGKSFFSLGALVSALQVEGDCSIVLNQKILTQENKKSTIFVGDNVPFAGSIVQTIGLSQQTTSNIEYRDIGVSLHITPLLGNNDIITLDISEEITEALERSTYNSSQLNGITTSKTNMATSAHVPDGHFLILSGMTRNASSATTTGPPCLGGVPMLSTFFNRKDNRTEKKNILIFVKPHIIHSAKEYEELSSTFSHTVP